MSAGTWTELPRVVRVGAGLARHVHGRPRTAVPETVAGTPVMRSDPFPRGEGPLVPRTGWFNEINDLDELRSPESAGT